MRATAFVSRPTSDWSNNVQSLSSTTLFMVARVGPTVFTIKDEKDETFRVTLGNPHVCSCGSQEDSCIHKLFCLIKVLKVPMEHSLCYQTSLTDKEMDQVLDGIQSNARRPIRVRTKLTVVQTDDTAAENNVARQPLTDDDENTCPICQDEMTNEQALTWCRKGCGQNLHAKCMMKCAQHNISNKHDVTCPLCRNPWDLTILRADCRGKASLKHTFSPVQCSSCKCNQRTIFYRCVECSQLSCSTSGKPLDFCKECFERMGSTHLSHHFLSSDVTSETSHGLDWMPCKNPATKGVIMNPQLVRELQGRELGVNDYELLLQLADGGPTPDFTSLCVESLPPLPRNKSSKKAGTNTHCWCAAGLSPSRIQSEIIISSPVTGAAILNMFTDSPTRSDGAGGGGNFSNENSPQNLLAKSLRILPCRHVAHDRCLKEEISILVADDPAQITEYRCSHLECGKRIFIGLNRRRRSKKAAGAEGAKKESAKSGTADSGQEDTNMSNGIVGARCFGNTDTGSSGGRGGGPGNATQVNRNVPRRGRNSYGVEVGGAAELDSSVMGVQLSNRNNNHPLGLSYGGGGGALPGWVNTDRLDPLVYRQAEAQSLPSISVRNDPSSMNNILPDGVMLAVGAVRAIPQQRGSGVGGGGRRPPMGRRVRLRALGDGAAAGSRLGAGAGANVEAYADSVSSVLGSLRRESVTAVEPAAGAGAGIGAGGTGLRVLNRGNNFSNRGLMAMAAGSSDAMMDLGSLSDRSPSPAPLPSIAPPRRAASLSERQFPSSSARAQEVKSNVQSILVYNLNNSRKKNRDRDANVNIDHNLVMSCISLSAASASVGNLSNAHAGGIASQNNNNSSSTSNIGGNNNSISNNNRNGNTGRRPSGQIIRGNSLRNAGPGGPLAALNLQHVASSGSAVGALHRQMTDRSTDDT